MPAVILDQAHWTQLEQVQAQVEQKVRYQSDMERFGVPDWWEPAVDRGDCEDIVLAKRKRLVEMGWPADSLRIAVVIDGRGELHAVLTVDVVSEKGAPGTYVLDSHFQHVEPWQYLNQYGYTWLERSKPGSRQWARLDNGAPAETTRIAMLASVMMPASPRWGDTRTAAAAPMAPASVTVTASVALAPAGPEVPAARPVPAVLDTRADQALLIRATFNDGGTSAAEAEDDVSGGEASGHGSPHGGRHGHGQSRAHSLGRRHRA